MVLGQGAEALSGHHLRPPALGCLNQHGGASVRECALGPVLCVEVSQAWLAVPPPSTVEETGVWMPPCAGPLR